MKNVHKIRSSSYVSYKFRVGGLKAFEGIEAADVFRTSLADLTLSAAPVAVSLAEGHKCDRCWKVLTEVDPAEKLCGRCAKVVANWGAK